MKTVGEYCRYFRMGVLQMTLFEISNGKNIKTISGFEHGRSTNVEHLSTYLNACDSKEMKKEFMLGLIIVLDRSGSDG